MNEPQQESASDRYARRKKKASELRLAREARAALEEKKDHQNDLLELRFDDIYVSMPMFGSGQDIDFERWGRNLTAFCDMVRKFGREDLFAVVRTSDQFLLEAVSLIRAGLSGGEDAISARMDELGERDDVACGRVGGFVSDGWMRQFSTTLPKFLSVIRNDDSQKASASTSGELSMKQAEGNGRTGEHVDERGEVTGIDPPNSDTTDDATPQDDTLPRKARKLSPSRTKAKAVYDWAMSAIPHAEDMKVAELFEAIENHPSNASEALPSNAEAFGKYLREAGVKRYLKQGDKKGGSVRRSDEV